MSDSEAAHSAAAPTGSAAPLNDARSVIAQSHLKPSPFVTAAMTAQAARDGRLSYGSTTAVAAPPSPARHQYTVRADLRILGYIGADQHFFLLCPCSPTPMAPMFRLVG